jgi:hypothetical protein
MTGDERHVPTANPRLQPKGDESERILQDAFLSGGRDMSGAGKLSAGTMSKALHDEEPAMFARDDSWGNRAEEEGAPGEGGPSGLWHRLRHFFSG